MEDDLKKKWKMTSKKREKKEDELQKDEPINQNQPNWL